MWIFAITSTYVPPHVNPYRRFPQGISVRFGPNLHGQRSVVEPAGRTVEWPGGETPGPNLAGGNSITKRMQLLCSIS